MHARFSDQYRALAVCLIAGALLPGCVVVSGDGGAGARSVGRGDPGGPFAPASIRVFPLTHVARPTGGEPTLITHVELRDRWGDAVKGTGELRIVLEPAGGDLAGARPTSWNINLSDLDLNARVYAPATRTYRVRLRGLPAWAAEASREAGGGGQRAQAAAQVTAVLMVPGGEGRLDALRDSLVVPLTPG